jgi:hypothetical protein
MTVQQLVSADETVFDAEFVLKNPHRILAAQATDPAVGLGGPGLESLDELLLLRRGQLRLRPAASLGCDRIEAVIAIGNRHRKGTHLGMTYRR